MRNLDALSLLKAEWQVGVGGRARFECDHRVGRVVLQMRVASNAEMRASGGNGREKMKFAGFIDGRTKGSRRAADDASSMGSV
jgi:hypothetical protein